MDPELRKLLELAQRAKAGGVSDADIDKALKGRGAPNFAALTRMAQGPREPPLKPSFLQRIGTALTAGPTQAASPGADLAATRARLSEQRLRGQLQPQADLSRMVGRGMTLGLFEEIAAAPRLVTGLFGGKTFGEARQAEQEKTAAARERLGPGGSFAAEMAGALAIPGKAGAEFVKRGASIIGKMGRGSALGAGVGGVVGAADAPTAEGETGIGIRTVGGTVVGATFGAALPLAGALLTVPGKIASIIWGVFSPSASGRRIAQQQLKEIGKGIGRSPQDLEAEFARQQARRPGLVTPADVDPIFGAVAQTRAPASSGAVRPLVERVQGRTTGRGVRLSRDLPELTKTQRLDVAKEVAEGRVAQLRVQLYQPLEKAWPDIVDPRIARLVKHVDVAPLWQKVRPRAGKQPASLRHLQDLRDEMQDFIDSTAQTTKHGKPTRASRAMKDLREELTETLNDIIPGYRAANLRYWQANESIRAFDAGARAFKKTWSGDEVTRAIADLQQAVGPEEAGNALTAFRHGYVDELTRSLLSKSKKATARRLADFDESERQALRAIFPNEQNFQEFMERAVLENRLSALNIRTGAGAVQVGEGGVQAGLASPFVGLRFLALRELFRRAGPEKTRAAADATLTRLLSTDPQAMARLTAAMRAPGGGGAGLLTGALPGPISGLLQSGR